MFITFGTGFYGKVAQVNDQWVETKFFSVMFIPIFPLGSMFVTGSEFKKRRGFNIGMHKQSIIAAYGRLLCFIIAIIAFFLGFQLLTSEFERGKATTPFIWGIVFGAAWVYFWFFYGKATADETTIRNRVGKVMGIYALPNWFDYPTLKNMLGSLEQQYKNDFSDSDWKTDVQNANIERYKRPLLFALALFNCMVYDIPENDELYALADQLCEDEQAAQGAYAV